MEIKSPEISVCVSPSAAKGVLWSQLEPRLDAISPVIVNQLADARSAFVLNVEQEIIRLLDTRKKKIVAIQVDFAGGAKAHRRKFGGGKGQDIAKAVGLNKSGTVSVLDATAGMGGDAFVLACLGCEMTLVERSPVVRLLLWDGLRRARDYGQQHDNELLDIVNRMQLLEGDSLELIQECAISPQVIYLDPMFPERKKSAQVKKEMQFFHEIVGQDADADKLLPVALTKAQNRVVVKRPKLAPFLNEHEPSYQLHGKANRFDVYALKAFN